MRRTSWTTLDFSILDRVPLDEMAGRVASLMMRIYGWARPIEGSCAEVVIEEISDDLVGKELHSA